MEKYGCSVVENMELRIKELENTNFKCAADMNELRDLRRSVQEIREEEEKTFNNHEK